MNFDQLITSLRELDSSLKGHVARTTNIGLTVRNWLVGAYIVEFEQNGKERAKYGERLIPEIALELKIKGLAVRNLEACRLFYQAYPTIPQSVTAELPSAGVNPPKPGFVTRPEFALPVSTLVEKLTFTHIVELLRLDDPLQRAFYEIECVKAGWSVRELKRQIGSLLFERMGLSKDKEKLMRMVSCDAKAQPPGDIIKDPYVFEFLGLKPKEVFREDDLETALLDHLQEFLLELGCGFCFEDRQRKIRIGTSDYFVDLVFYHRKLHCHVLIELKVEAFNHVNAGQLNTYVNYFKKHEMAEGDNPPIGLLLCTNKDHALVEYALGGMDENLFVSTYKVALPKLDELEAFLIRETQKIQSS